MFWGAGVKGAARETILCLGGCAGKVTCGVHMAACLSPGISNQGECVFMCIPEALCYQTRSRSKPPALTLMLLVANLTITK